MERKNEWLMKAMPWLLIFGGFLSLSMFPPEMSFCCMGMGIIMLLERKWPEKWGEEEL